jgi:excinuclease UvrABC ATPase subunit
LRHFLAGDHVKSESLGAVFPSRSESDRVSWLSRPLAGLFRKCKEIVRKVQAMHDAGLAYLTFGQPLSPLSVEEGCWGAPPGQITDFHQ